MDEQQSMQYFYEIFDPSLPRLGPGDDASTRRAIDLLLPLLRRPGREQEPATLRMLDIGCGCGPQTLQIAKCIDGPILAVDNHQPFLDELMRRAEAAGVAGRITPQLRDMSELRPDEGTYDLIWSEGALSIMGFDRGLEMCHDLLEPGGVAGISELVWFLPDAPDECRDLFAGACPDMVDSAASVERARRAGFDVVDHWHLPESVWWDSFYHPVEARVAAYREEHEDDVPRLGVADWIQHEIDIYRRHSRYYGYVMLALQRR